MRATFVLLMIFSFTPIVAIAQSENEETRRNKDDLIGLENLLREAEELEEIALTEEQLENIKEERSRLLTEMMNKRTQARDQLEKIENPQQADIERHNRRFQRATNAYLTEIESTITDVLLPVQVERLRQLNYWRMINVGGYPKLFEHSSARKKLGLRGSQLKRINAKTSELQKQFEKELAELKRKYREKLNQELDREQQLKLNDLLGEPSSIREIRIKF